MRPKTHHKGIYLFLIIALLMTGVSSENIQKHSPFVSAAHEVSSNDSAFPASFISAAGKTLPVEQFLSEKTACTQEAVAGIRQRSSKSVLRSSKNYAAGMTALTALILSAVGIWFSFCHEKRKGILSNIIIMNYIHLQDGQKP